MTNIQSKILILIFGLIIFNNQLFAQTFDFNAMVTHGCTPLQITFNNTTDILYRNDYTYQWTVETGKYSTETNVVQNTYLQPGNYTIQMKVYDADLQLVSTVTKTDYITAFRDPDVVISSDKQTDCIGKPFVFSVDSEDADAPITSYTWIISDGTSYIGKTPPAHYFSFADNFDIFVAVQDANGCTNRIRRTISVSTYDDLPQTQFNASSRKTCDPTLEVKFTNNTPGTNIVSYLWDFGDGVTSTDKSPTHIYNGYGSYNAILTANAANGCSAIMSQSIQLIDYRPNITIADDYKTITDVNKACVENISFTDATTPPNTTISYAWDFGNNGSTESTTNSYATTISSGGFNQIKLTVSNSTCTKSITKPFVVETPLEVTYSLNDTFNCVAPANLVYTATTNVPGTTYLWTINGRDTSGNNIAYSFNEGIFNDALIATSPNGCKFQISKPGNIEVAVPRVWIDVISANSGCKPLTVEFDTIYYYNTTRDSVKTLQWDFKNDGVYDQISGVPATNVYDSVGVFTAKVEIETYKGCKAFDITRDRYPNIEWDNIKVGDTARADLDFPDTIVCGSKTLEHILLLDDPNKYKTIYDTLDIFYNPKVPNRYPVPGNTLVYPRSDETNISDSIGMHDVNFIMNDHGCKVRYADYTYTQVVEIIGGVPTTRTDSVQTTIRVKSPITEILSTPSNCITPYDYMYFLSKKIDTQNWTWSIKKVAGESQFPFKEFSHNTDTVYINFDNDTLGTGNYVIQIKAYCDTTECIDAHELVTKVRAIKANFKLVDSIPCLGDTARFVITGGHDIDSSFWYYNHGTIKTANISTRQDSVFYIFDKKNIKDVTVICKDENNCYDTVSKPVKVYKPDAHFFADILSDCIAPNPFTSQFTDSTLSDTAIVTRNWTFGNGLTNFGNDSIVSTQYSVEGLTSPSLEVVDILGCKDTLTLHNYIRPVVPNSKFVVSSPKVCLNHEALFVRNTTNPNYDNNIHRYTWDFGDGSSDSGSLQDTVPHIYAFESMGSKFNVKLTAYSMSPEGNECVSESTGQVEVKDVSSRIVIRDMDKCKQSGQKFIVYLNNTIYSSGYTSVIWTKVDNDVETLIGHKPNIQVVTFDNYGYQKLKLHTITPYYGCEDDTTSVTIDVPGYEAQIISDKDEVCVREDLTFSLANAKNVERYPRYWEFGDGNANYTDLVTATHNYTSLAETINNTYQVHYIVNAPNCLSEPIVKNIKVFPVLADFSRGEFDTDTTGCAPYEITLFNNSVGGSNFVWDFGDGTTSTENNPKHTFPVIDTVYNVKISITSNICDDHITKPVSTHPLANVDFSLDTLLCFGQGTNITATGDFSSLIWSPAKYFANATAPITTVSPEKSGYMVANMQTQYGCNSSDSVFVYVQQFPKYLGAPDSLLLYYFSADSLKLTNKPDAQIIAGQLYNVNNDKIEGVHYAWSPDTYLSCNDCPSPNIDLQCGTATRPSCIDFPETVQYTIYMTDSLGCFENQQTILFNIAIDTKAALPQAFSPNNDGENDFAFVRGWGIKEFLDVKIYNRWGQIIFQSSDINQGWDGTYKSEPQAMDTYAYTIRIINSKDEEEFIKGYITLLR